MTADEAAACWKVLSRKEGTPDPRSWGEQFVELNRVLRRGSALEQAERLHRLYRAPGPLPDTHQRMLAKYEDSLFPALAAALGKTPKALKQALHRGQPAFSEPPETPAQLPEPGEAGSYAHPARPDEPPLEPQAAGPLSEMLAALRARVPEAKRAEMLDMLSEWVGRPWNSIVELGRPALEVIWAWYEPIARAPGADAVPKRVLYFRCGRHFLWVLEQFAEHPAAPLLAVEGYLAINKDKKYRRLYLDTLPTALRASFRAEISRRLPAISARQAAPLQEWLAER